MSDVWDGPYGDTNISVRADSRCWSSRNLGSKRIIGGLPSKKKRHHTKKQTNESANEQINNVKGRPGIWFLEDTF